MNASNVTADMDPLEPLAVDPAGVGRLLSLSRATVFKLHSCGRLPLPVRLGERCARWIVAELHEWLKAGAPTRDVWERPKEVRHRADAARRRALPRR